MLSKWSGPGGPWPEWDYVMKYWVHCSKMGLSLYSATSFMGSFQMFGCCASVYRRLLVNGVWITCDVITIMVTRSGQCLIWAYFLNRGIVICKYSIYGYLSIFKTRKYRYFTFFNLYDWSSYSEIGSKIGWQIDVFRFPILYFVWLLKVS